MLGGLASTRAWTRYAYFKKSAIAAAIGVSGTLYYTSRTIHADGNTDRTRTNEDGNREYRQLSRNAQSRRQSTADFFSRDDKRDKRIHEASGTFRSGSGISRFDTKSVPSW
jgi:hypothetical protein